MSALRQDGYGATVESAASALPLEVYKLVDTEPTELGISYVITNHKVLEPPKPTTGDIVIKKVSSLNLSKSLQGAEFDLYMVDEESGFSIPELGIGEKVVKVNDVTLATNAEGVVEIEGIQLDEAYYLVEAQSPTGYNLLACPVHFTVSSAADVPEIALVIGSPGQSWAFVQDEVSNVLVVKNDEGYRLPETGGTGTGPFAAAGSLLLLVGGSLVFLRRKIGERGAPQ